LWLDGFLIWELQYISAQATTSDRHIGDRPVKWTGGPHWCFEQFSNLAAGMSDPTPKTPLEDAITILVSRGEILSLHLGVGYFAQ
jgi:hypothetical protein